MSKLNLFENKVAQRILISLLVVALIPAGLLGYFSYQQVRDNLHKQIAQSLRKSTKTYAINWVNRLSLYQSALETLEIDQQPASQAKTTLTKTKALNAFDTLILDDGAGRRTPLIGTDKTPQVPSFPSQNEFGAGKTLVKSVDDGTEEGGSPVWMLVGRSGHAAQTAILMAKLNSELLWDSENIAPSLFWIIGENNRLLFSSDPAIPLPESVKRQITLAPSGEVTWDTVDETFIGSFWKLPPVEILTGFPVVVVQAQNESLAFAPISQFSATYPLLISLALLIAAYLGIRLIINNLKPLQRLKTATQHIAEGDFNYQVKVRSQDEFEDLANSFNEMTRRLREQFDVLSTMAEIDRHILSSTNAEDIIEVAFSRLPGLLGCDLISIARIDPQSYQVSDIRFQLPGKQPGIYTQTIKFDVKAILALLQMQHSVIVTDGTGQYAELIEQFGTSADWRYLLVPIVVDESLSSIICLGYQGVSPLPPEIVNIARNFGDRIAVALSKAAWENKLYQQAHYDTLTGLPNRLVLNDRLRQEMARAERNNTEFAVIFIDLDRFKSINDSLGHAAGDELLSQVAKIFVNCIRETDLVVRMGGDEFVMLITDLHPEDDSTLLVTSIGEKIMNSLKQTLVVAGQPMTFTASLGIALYPQDASNIEDLLKNADAAMYHAKNQGRSKFQFYSSEINAFALENLRLEHELRQAIAKNELVVHYQPKVDTSGHIVGAEALIRWRHKELGLISPAKFVPLAEQSGLIVEIGEWVLKQTCLFLNDCQAKGIPPVRISVNLSAIEFHRPQLLEFVQRVMHTTGVDPSLLELEITESVAIGKAKACIERMEALKKMGLKLSMDDFGTGFSSLSYLKELPLDILKIDQSFMRKIDTETNSQAIVRAILALANGLGLESVAEGVETEAQVAFLKMNQCDIYQGFLFHKPMPSEELAVLLAKPAEAIGNLPRQQAGMK